MSKKRVFGELELAILKIFHDQKIRTVHDVIAQLGSKDKYTTVMTVMSRLVEKKQLARQRKGQQYEYWISESRKNAIPSLLDKLKQKLFGGKSASMASYLIESAEDITDSELSKMETLIKGIRKSRKES